MSSNRPHPPNTPSVTLLPSGRDARGTDDRSTLRGATEFTPEATGYLIEIARDKDGDSRNPIVAISMLYDRAWGKPKEYDRAHDNGQQISLTEVISQMTPDERANSANCSRHNRPSMP